MKSPPLQIHETQPTIKNTLQSSKYPPKDARGTQVTRFYGGHTLYVKTCKVLFTKQTHNRNHTAACARARRRGSSRS